MSAPPRNHTPRSDRPTRGGAVAKIAAAKGRPLMPWQRTAADVALEVDPETGLYWYGTVLIFVPRQAGKTKLEGDVADHRCLTTRRGRVWYTAQTGKDASSWMRDEHFETLDDATIFGQAGTPQCRYRLSRRAGQEGVAWPATRSTFRVFPPKRTGLHSKQSDLVFVDEAWAYDAEQGAAVRQAIRPTMATRRGSQLWVVSTKGDDASTYLDGYIAMGEASLTQPNTRVCIVDYGIADDVDPEDIDAVAAAHPAYGYTITRETLVDALNDFKTDPTLGGVNGFARGYGNRPTRTRVAAIPAGLWTDAGKPRPEIPARVGIGIDVTPLGDRVAIGGAWRDDAMLWGEVVHDGPTTRELPALVARLAKQRQSPIGYDPASLGALDIIDAIGRNHRDVKTVALTTGQYGAACLAVDSALRAGTFAHSRQAPLDAAVEVATKRPLGDGGFGWGRKTSAGNIAPLVAVTIAARMFDALPRPRRSSGILLPSSTG